MTPPDSTHRSVALSVVIPVYGCADCLSTLHARLRSTLDALEQSYEIVFVDDGSPDGSWPVLVEIARSDDAVVLVRLSRNFGQQAAITAGLAESRGGRIVIMDCDLQDRPEDISILLAGAEQGFDIVLTHRAKRRQTLFRRLAARAYFRIRNRLLGMQVSTEHGSLLLVSRRVANAFLAIRDLDRHHVLIFYWLGFPRTTVDVEHLDRHAGRSSYKMSTLIRIAFDGLFFQTTVLLRWIVYLGFLIAAAGVLLALFLVGVYFSASPYPGWTSLAVLILVIGGFIIMSTGIAGLYVGKIFDQVKERPLYVVEELIRDSTTTSGDQLTRRLRSQ